MIIGSNRKEVIENIKKAAEAGDFHRKVETGDPVLSLEESRRITNTYLEERKYLSFKAKSAAANLLAKTVSCIMGRNTRIVGLEEVGQVTGGILITSNHFSPLENTLIRYLVSKMGRKKLGIVCQASNFAMPGGIGFLMNYADTIPLAADSHYLARDFLSILKERLCERRDAILLYPEQEMWFHYRKVRPPKSGAYFYAAKLGVPILSCFVEIRDREEDDTAEFKKLSYTVHVLGVLRPESTKTVRENTEYLAQADYQLKKNCYEKVYGKKLNYDFEPWDIAGWKETI